LGHVRVLLLCLGVLCLKSQIPSTKSQINHKFQIPNRFKAIVFLFGILNFGHCYLFVFWDFNMSMNFQQSKSPLGITKVWSSGPGFFTADAEIAEKGNFWMETI